MSLEQKLVFLGAGFIALGVFLSFFSFSKDEIFTPIEVSGTSGIKILILSAVLGFVGYKRHSKWVVFIGTLLFFPLVIFPESSADFLTWPGFGSILIGSGLALFAGFRMYNHQKKNS